jgi:hypothetical protein
MDLAWGEVHQGAVRAVPIEIARPRTGLRVRIVSRRQLLNVQALVAQASVEVLSEGVYSGLSWRDEI